MHITHILQGRFGHAAKCFVAGVALSELAWAINRQLNRTSKPEDEQSAFDKALEDEMLARVKDNGTQQATPTLDVEEAVAAHAAAYVLYKRYINEPQPENGRPSEHLKKYLVALPKAVLEGINRMSQRNFDAQKAEAAMLGADFTAREAALKAEIEATATKLMESIKSPWLDAYQLFSDEENEDLINTILDGTTNAGINMVKAVTNAADRTRDAMRKRMEAGQYAKLDASIYALTTVGQAAARVNTNGEDSPPAGAVPVPERT